MSTPLRLVQLSDLHQLTDQTAQLLGMNPYESLQAVLNLLKHAPTSPDVIVLTGDLAQDHQHTTYTQIADLFADWDTPVYWLAGNHDLAPDVISPYLSKQPFCAEKQFCLKNWQCILLNSQIKEAIPGYLEAEQLDFLAQTLQHTTQPHCLVALHHQPVAIGSAWLDTIGLQNQADFWHIIESYPNVRAVIWGHIHQAFDSKRNTVVLHAAPSTWVQFLPGANEFTLDPKAAPGYRWYDLHDDGRVNTGVVRVDNFDYTPPASRESGY